MQITGWLGGFFEKVMFIYLIIVWSFIGLALVVIIIYGICWLIQLLHDLRIFVDESPQKITYNKCTFGNFKDGSGKLRPGVRLDKGSSITMEVK